MARAARVEQVWPSCRFAVGVHPHHAHLFAANPVAAAELVARRLEQLPSARAIGEIGLDYHYDFSPPEVQHDVFRQQLRLARARQLPVVIHTREAEADTLRILREEGHLELRGVFHCFTSDLESADRALAHRLLPVAAGDPHLSQSRCASRRRSHRAARPPAGGDRQPVSGAGSVSWQAKRAGLRRSRRRAAGGRAWCRARRFSMRRSTRTSSALFRP